MRDHSRVEHVSWRAQTDPEVQRELDGLLGVVMPFAEEQLRKHGEFHPFGMVIHEDGSLVPVAAALADGLDGPAEKTLSALCDGAAASARTLRAAAFVSDILFGDADAVRVELEHRDGPSLTVVFPYERTGLWKRLVLGQPTLAPPTPHLWSRG